MNVTLEQLGVKVIHESKTVYSGTNYNEIFFQGVYYDLLDSTDCQEVAYIIHGEMELDIKGLTVKMVSDLLNEVMDDNKLEIEVERTTDTKDGNPVYIVRKWNNRSLLNELIASKYFKEFDNKKDGKGVKTSPDKAFTLGMFRDNLLINGIDIKATPYKKTV
ncbi:MAG: hypothetical protein ACRC6B_00220 [Fusobacteriaceae bacterium]